MMKDEGKQRNERIRHVDGECGEKEGKCRSWHGLGLCLGDGDTHTHIDRKKERKEGEGKEPPPAPSCCILTVTSSDLLTNW